MEQIHTVPAACELLTIPPRTLRDWIAKRKIGVQHVGRAVRIPQSEITRILEEGFTPARPA